MPQLKKESGLSRSLASDFSSVGIPSNKIAYRQVISQIRSRAEMWACLLFQTGGLSHVLWTYRASPNTVHIYKFEIDENELQAGCSLLDQEEHRRAMRWVGIGNLTISQCFWSCFRVTYSHEYNFIVRYVPGSVHQAAHASWSIYMHQALRDLLPHPQPTAAPRCDFIAASGTFRTPCNLNWT